MMIQLGTISEDKRTVFKSPVFAEQVECSVKEPCTITQPYFIIEYKADRLGYNYAYIPSWGRYYFIDNITVLKGCRMILNCTVDVLYTYRDSIKYLQCCVTRQENMQEPFLADEQMTFLETYDVISKYGTLTHFLSAENLTSSSKCFVLGVSGGANSHLSDIDGYTVLTSEPADWSTRYMFYYVNTGTSYSPNMRMIGDLVYEQIITSSDASSFATVSNLFGTVYRKD